MLIPKALACVYLLPPMLTSREEFRGGFGEATATGVLTLDGCDGVLAVVFRLGVLVVCYEEYKEQKHT